MAPAGYSTGSSAVSTPTKAGSFAGSSAASTPTKAGSSAGSSSGSSVASTPTRAAGSSAASEADPKLNHLVQAQLSKTKMCGMFIRGTCPDAKCRFAHSSDELRKAPDLTKTAICRAFAKGACTKGSQCGFAHGEQDLRVTPTVYKTQLCNFHERGRCKKGDNCRHAHGRDQLRSFQANKASPGKTDVPRGINGKHRSGPPELPVPSSRFEKGLSDLAKVDRSEGVPLHGDVLKFCSSPSLGGALWNGQSSMPTARTLEFFSSPTGDRWPVIPEQMPDAFEPMKIDLGRFSAQQPARFEPFADPPFPNSGEGARAFMAARAIEAAQEAQKHKAACEQASAAAARFAAAASESGMCGLSDSDRDFESILGSLTMPPMQMGGASSVHGRSYAHAPGLESNMPWQTVSHSEASLHQCASMGPSWIR